MTITKLKTKNQITIPALIVKRLGIKPNELFSVDIKDNYIILMPVHMEPKYSVEELNAIDGIVEKEKKSAKKLKAGGEFSSYLKGLAKK